ncbi:MAG: phosphatase PAP2 family protein [Actinomycetota bacterium]|nr:phosphatase PAP2 family protein [Actinomycetota bacterium]
MRVSRGIGATAWALVAVGIAAPVLRRRVDLPPAAVLGSAVLAPVALCVAVPRSRARDLALCTLNMWAYMAAYEMPNDDPARLAARARLDYPLALDRALGLGAPPTIRLQRAFASPDAVRPLEGVLVWCHWIWFLVPHASLGYVLLRDRARFPAAAARMYAVFDLGAVFYWAIPTAPPWWASAHGCAEDGHEIEIRRMMIEYGEQFWGERWPALYDLLGGNPLAAMPSLHFATSLMAAHLLFEVGTVAGLLGSAYTAVLGAALVYLGEHYAVDLFAGAVLTEAVRAQAPRAAPLIRRVSRALPALRARSLPASRTAFA